jgi:hypothetical protein
LEDEYLLEVLVCEDGETRVARRDARVVRVMDVGQHLVPALVPKVVDEARRALGQVLSAHQPAAGKLIGRAQIDHHKLWHHTPGAHVREIELERQRNRKIELNL